MLYIFSSKKFPTVKLSLFGRPSMSVLLLNLDSFTEWNLYFCFKDCLQSTLYFLVLLPHPYSCTQVSFFSILFQFIDSASKLLLPFYYANFLMRLTLKTIWLSRCFLTKLSSYRTLLIITSLYLYVELIKH